MKTLKIHNTLGNTLEVFKPIDPLNVRVYACGPTVYNYAHIGNARMAVVNDLLIRFLKTLYPKYEPPNTPYSSIFLDLILV